MQLRHLDIFENFGKQTLARADSSEPHDLPEIIARRSVPGILIFTSHVELVYLSTEARNILPPAGLKNGGPAEGPDSVQPVPETITNLCRQLKALASSQQSPDTNGDPAPTLWQFALSPEGPEAISFRAFWLGGRPSASNGTGYILVLIERVCPTKKTNLHKTIQEHRLSKREVETVEFLIRGHTNKEIADKLCVCVYTIEGHLKKIMKKMQVANRTGILAKLLDMS